MHIPGSDQFVAQLAAGFDKERAAAHRWVADFQVEDLRRVRRAKLDGCGVVFGSLLFESFAGRDFLLSSGVSVVFLSIGRGLTTEARRPREEKGVCCSLPFLCVSVPLWLMSSGCVTNCCRIGSQRCP